MCELTNSNYDRDFGMMMACEGVDGTFTKNYAHLGGNNIIVINVGEQAKIYWV